MNLDSLKEKNPLIGVFCNYAENNCHIEKLNERLQYVKSLMGIGIFGVLSYYLWDDILYLREPLPPIACLVVLVGSLYINYWIQKKSIPFLLKHSKYKKLFLNFNNQHQELIHWLKADEKNRFIFTDFIQALAKRNKYEVDSNLFIESMAQQNYTSVLDYAVMIYRRFHEKNHISIQSEQFLIKKDAYFENQEKEKIIGETDLKKHL